MLAVKTNWPLCGVRGLVFRAAYYVASKSILLVAAKDIHPLPIINLSDIHPQYKVRLFRIHLKVHAILSAIHIARMVV